MGDCCQGKTCEIEKLIDRQSKTLKIVLGINLVMFVVEIIAGFLAGSVSLLADSLDMLGDTLAYGFSLYVVARGARMKALAAIFKGMIMAVFGLFVLGEVFYKILLPHVPVFEAIGLMGLVALGTNSFCLALLWRHRSEDINMKSVWLCSRNDIIANTSVLAAAVGVWFTATAWPDVLVGLALACLFLRSAVHVLKESISEYQQHGV
ncbi:MAG: cation transporter [Syntrophaceae bacterium]|nr:cation transporter [Syntrophaceae bacterium]